jgi:hypothetical protein|uniref:ATP synthase F0 subunit 4 n=1 Tax=Phaeocystis globosa TaxID=33658 RepID=S5FNK7_9EUKA|nr:ATP synthase F0 subunit 4 [Phaeocystis globosa]
MNVFVLLFLSFFILLSSLSENFEFLVHNEESLLILCFIAFIFFAYSFLSVGFYDDFQKRVSDLEQQLVLVACSRFNVLLSSFNELFFRKDLVLRFQFILGLLRSGLYLDYSVFSSSLTFFFDSLLLFQLSNVLKLKNQILKPLKNRLNHFSLVPFLFGDSKAAISLVSHKTFARFIKKSIFSENLQFFHKSIILKHL